MDNPDFAALVKKAGKKQIVIRLVLRVSIFPPWGAGPVPSYRVLVC
jgi:hypothetical protein